MILDIGALVLSKSSGQEGFLEALFNPVRVRKVTVAVIEEDQDQVTIRFQNQTSPQKQAPCNPIRSDRGPGIVSFGFGMFCMLFGMSQFAMLFMGIAILFLLMALLMNQHNKEQELPTEKLDVDEPKQKQKQEDINPFPKTQPEAPYEKSPIPIDIIV